MSEPFDQPAIFDQIEDNSLDDGPIKLYAHYSKEEIKILRAHGFDPQNPYTGRPY